MKTFAFCLLVPLAGSLCAEVAGAPRVVRPGPIPLIWGTTGNDLFGLAPNKDDYRTATMELGANLNDRVLVSSNASVLTDRVGRGRLDQNTQSLSLIFWRDRGQDCSKLDFFSLGLGLREEGKIEGYLIQNGLHQTRQIEEVDLPYDFTRVQYRPVTVLSARRSWDLEVRDDVQYHAWVETQGLVVETGRLETETSAMAGLLFRKDFAIWGGLRASTRSDQAYSSSTLKTVDEHERGCDAVVGVSAGFLYAEAGHTIGRNLGFGTLGFVLSRPDPGIEIPPEQQCKQDLYCRLASTIPGFGGDVLVSTSMLSPDWHYELGSSVFQPRPYLRYRVGRVDEHAPSGMHHDGQSVLGGIMGYLIPPPQWDYIRFYGLMGGGWRREELRWYGDGAPIVQEAERQTAALDAEAGLSLRLKNFGIYKSSSSIDFSFDIARTLWIPLQASAVTSDGRSWHLNRIKDQWLAGFSLSFNW